MLQGEFSVWGFELMIFDFYPFGHQKLVISHHFQTLGSHPLGCGTV